LGYTPLDGLVMSTRGGSVDPGIILDLAGRREVPVKQLLDGLQHDSGLLGLSRGRSADTRDLVPAAVSGDRDAALALDVFTLAARQGIAAAAACLNRLDALVFTGESALTSRSSARRSARSWGSWAWPENLTRSSTSTQSSAIPVPPFRSSRSPWPRTSR
jgi:acetate kinase